MAKGRMLLISGILAISLATIGVVSLMFIGEDSPLKKLNQPAEVVNGASQIEAAPMEDVLADEGENKTIGIRQETDEQGLHDILFESAKGSVEAISGPVTLTVQEKRLELLTPADDKIRKSMEGRSPSTVVMFKIDIENTSNEAVIFNIDEAKAVADTSEVAIINAKLSTTFGSDLAPNEKKSGTIMIDFKSKSRDVTTITLKVLPTYNTNYDEVGDAIQLKVPMY